ncbi:MAG: hypothetical protein DRN95_04435 [Candidatus Hydrothermarchaeota archaeon]|nr:MAG: hypothetical protein DRN95_04435 [Candidatus Hydrothermarchaeota archaeon]
MIMPTQRWPEKRLRIRKKDDVMEGHARLNPRTMEYLKINNVVEIVVAGKKRYRFKVLALDSLPENEIWCNTEELRMYGIEDNSIVTVRAPLKGEK